RTTTLLIEVGRTPSGTIATPPVSVYARRSCDAACRSRAFQINYDVTITGLNHQLVQHCLSLKSNINFAGSVVNLSGRPSLCMSLCMSLMNAQATIGSLDHAVYAVDVMSARFSKALFGGNQGHIKWVACIPHPCQVQFDAILDVLPSSGLIMEEKIATQHQEIQRLLTENPQRIRGWLQLMWPSDRSWLRHSKKYSTCNKV
ncbi:hypothetical protein GOP47_0030815, partial [Adiantum capillus-veneris]